VIAYSRRMGAELLLYVGNKNYSSWSLRAYLALAATGAPFRDEVIPLDLPGSKAALRDVNPAGRVPVLLHGDLRVWDSLAICEYLAEVFPDAQLWPVERAARARARSISAEMHSGFVALRTDMPMDLRARRPGVGHTPDALADVGRIVAIWRECRASAAGGPFLFGRFSIADAMFAPVTGRFITYGVELDAASQAYVDAVQALPAMRAWRQAAEQESWTIDDPVL
jgi:glutathione S-transferase